MVDVEHVKKTLQKMTDVQQEMYLRQGLDVVQVCSQEFPERVCMHACTSRSRTVSSSYTYKTPRGLMLLACVAGLSNSEKFFARDGAAGHTRVSQPGSNSQDPGRADRRAARGVGGRPGKLCLLPSADHPREGQKAQDRGAGQGHYASHCSLLLTVLPITRGLLHLRLTPCPSKSRSRASASAFRPATRSTFSRP
jgi:hypothetical protein